MKSVGVLAFFGIVASALSASVDVTTEKNVTASGYGDVTAAAAADLESGAAAGAVDGAGIVTGLATVGGAIAGAASSPYM